MEIGILTDCLKKPSITQALETAGALGVSGVQIYATSGEFCYSALDNKKVAYYKDVLKQNHLIISALCGDMGGFGFEIKKDNANRILKTKEIIDLATKFNTQVVTTHIGVIPNDSADPIYKVMLDALTECGLYAKAKGVILAIETGAENAQILKSFIQKTSGGIGVNLDPANFTMVTGQDAVESVYLLEDYIVHTHVKDGIMIDKNISPKEVYHALAVGGISALNACSGFKEVAVGAGDVDFVNYFKALKSIGYNGFLTVEREAGDNPINDIKDAISFIKGHI